MILLVNDDGIDAPGLRALYRALRAVTGEAVLVVAPTVQRSGASHAITLDRNLTAEFRHQDGFAGFALDGTPADCAKLAIDAICPQPPRLVVSGINDGPNAGRSILYSGTVGAAMEAAVSGLPALAVSRMHGRAGDEDGALFAAGWAQRLLEHGGFPGRVVNLNLPATPAAGWGPLQVAGHALGGFHEWYRPMAGREGASAWRLEGEWRDGEPGGDAAQLGAGRPVMSLLAPDLNAEDAALRALVEAAR